MRRTALYLRVSTQDQTTANQERELRAVATRVGYEITKIYKDQGVSGANGRDKRPQFDALCKDDTGSLMSSWHGGWIGWAALYKTS